MTFPNREVLADTTYEGLLISGRVSKEHFQGGEKSIAHGHQVQGDLQMLRSIAFLSGHSQVSP